MHLRIAGQRQLEIARTPNREELLRRLRAFRRRLPADFSLDRDDAHTR